MMLPRLASSRVSFGCAAVAGAIVATVSCSSGPKDASHDAAVDAHVAVTVHTSTQPPPSDPACLQAKVDHSVAPKTARYIYPRHRVTPFYQWESNDGYCGEVSLIQAGMNSGQWMSQLAARSICGASGNGRDAPRGVSLSQSGPDGFCAAHRATPDYNAQLLLEDEAAANATTCLSNARLAHKTYAYGGLAGAAGYRDFMAWVKGETIAGRAVTVGVFVLFGPDQQYDHIVSVLAIGTNHGPSDASYYDDDVLYFDDHGAITSPILDYPPVPPGARGAKSGCAPFVYGYTFAELAQTRAGTDAGTNFFSILIPGLRDTKTYTGGDGVGLGPSVTGRNYGFSVDGPEDTDGETLPVTLRIVASRTAGVSNPADQVAGLDYENPFIGMNATGMSCTNVPPAGMEMTLEATVSALTTGDRYHLYEYDIDAVTGIGARAALAVPTSGFNAHAAMATKTTSFVARGSTYTVRVETDSRHAVVFRAVPADAP